ncbi:PpiC-type peptidyl-prolyl cis-trans isomerase [Pirellula staleyi DSM 6068]|uniref:PpiC-type peptidyl-prolyl cis-trans isomerase n=1 Tax=Pirellula staleyi (strain ATCC 27377 / DSM 6068 / ICPB 4128) TaxID=530564 RepID=D2R0K6_PIRSD|nr:peptidylprolyl isomerase [Pirellula staleyi]ADB16604.1 PpiC-type peptidyl-prolyl cis-trans isomerase [Pirellula staleyi DSM 6068]
MPHCFAKFVPLAILLGLIEASPICAQSYGDPYAQAPPAAGPAPVNRYPLPQQPAAPSYPPPVQQPQYQVPQYQVPQYQPPQNSAPQYQQPQYPPAAAGYPLPQGEGGAANYQASAAATGGASAPASSKFAPSQIVARVGNQFVLAGDVDAIVNQMIGPALARAKSDQEREAIESSRANASKMVLQRMIDMKVLYGDFERNIEKNAGRDKLDEIRKNIDRRMRDQFEKELASMREKVRKAKPAELQAMLARDPQMPVVAMLMEEHQIENLGDLDLLLRKYGSSLEKTQRYYRESTLGRSQVAENVREIPEVTHKAMLDYYQSHAEDFALQARARFEMMSVKFVGFPTRQAAYQTIGQMGNEVFYGAPFESVAKKYSQDPSASRGGYFDWTQQGALSTEVLDRAVFSLEPGKLSQILEDERGYYIVRVIEREEAGSVPFEVAQTKIKDAIETQYREENYRNYLTKVKQQTTIWTIYDETAGRGSAAPGTGSR